MEDNYNKELFLQMVLYIIYFWIFLISYIYLILYERIHLEIYEVFSYCFKGKSIEINRFLDDSIYVRKRRPRSLSEGSQPDSETDEFLNDIYRFNENEWTVH